MKKRAAAMLGCVSLTGLLATLGPGADSGPERKLLPKPGLFRSLTEPPCSYSSTQHRKNLVRNEDRVIAWLRGAHNGGAIPVRHFLSVPRVINDTYGLFFYDPDGDYVAAYKKDYGYEFYGWRGGLMVVKSRDGTLWSALSGVAFEGPQKGRRLERIPSMMTDWGHWLMLHPESTAYDLFDGKKYPVAPLPGRMSAEAQQTMGAVDGRLKPLATVLGVEVGAYKKAYPLEEAGERACFLDTVGGETVAVFWYRPTRSAAAFSNKLDGRRLSFYADPGSPDTAPFKDRETGSRWTLAGRAVDGPLRGRELNWVNSIQCRWYAWAAEYPETEVYAPRNPQRTAGLRGVLLAAAQATPERLRALHSEGTNAVVLNLGDRNAAADTAAARRIRAAGFGLYYWIEVGRNPGLADAHPEWMASLQGHPEWRRHFPGAPLPKPGEVVKNHPWVPVLYQEAFDAHLKRVATLLKDKPAPEGIFLNDLQGAPSACGCGNVLCRWTGDYGPVRTATRLPADAAAKFVAAVGRLSSKAKIIPVWTTECEEHDGAKDGACAGVGCFPGLCWKEYTAQLMPVAQQCQTLAALLPYRAFGRDLARYGPAAGWVKHALHSFAEMPPRRQGQAVSVSRVIAILQGWDVTPEQIQAQVRQSEEAGAGGHIVALMKIEQGWEPRVLAVGSRQ